MTSLFDVGKSAIQAYRQSLAVTGQNIANMNTDGYVRREADLKEVTASQGGITGLANQAGLGVRVADIRRSFDQFLVERKLIANSSFERVDSYVQQLKKLEDLLLPADADLGTQIGTFFRSLSDVSAAPSDLAPRAVALEQGRSLVSAFNSTAIQISQLQASTIGRMEDSIKGLNLLTDELSSINDRIISSGQSGRSPNSFLDLRDRLIEDISSLIDVSVSYTDRGLANVTIGASGVGPSLVDGTRKTAVGYIERDGGLEIILRPLSSRTPTSQLTSGMIAGLKEAYSTVSSVSRQVDQLATQVATDVNAQHRLGVAMDGLRGLDMFSSVNVAATPNLTNSVEVEAEITITDATALPTSDMIATFNQDKNIWQLTGDDLTKPIEGKSVLKGPGFEIQLTGPSVNGNSFTISPVKNAAENMQFLLVRPQDIAAASPDLVTASNTNISDATLDVSRITPSTYPASKPVSQAFSNSLSPVEAKDFLYDGLVTVIPSGTSKVDLASFSKQASAQFQLSGLSLQNLTQLSFARINSTDDGPHSFSISHATAYPDASSDVSWKDSHEVANALNIGLVRSSGNKSLTDLGMMASGAGGLLTITSASGDFETTGSNVPTMSTGTGVNTATVSSAVQASDLQVFTREGRHVAGLALTDAQITEFMTTSNGFDDEAVYSARYLNDAGNAYRGIDMDVGFAGGMYKIDLGSDGVGPSLTSGTSILPANPTQAYTMSIALSHGATHSVSIDTGSSAATAAKAMNDVIVNSGVRADAETRLELFDFQSNGVVTFDLEALNRAPVSVSADITPTNINNLAIAINKLTDITGVSAVASTDTSRLILTSATGEDVSISKLSSTSPQFSGRLSNENGVAVSTPIGTVTNSGAFNTALVSTSVVTDVLVAGANVSTNSVVGTGASLSVTRDTSGTYAVTIANGGSGSPNAYVVGDSFTVDGSLVGGTTSTHDVTLTVSSVSASGVITGVAATSAAPGLSQAQSIITPTITSGIGTGASFNVTMVNGVANVSLNAAGDGYDVNDTITILGSALGGTDGVNDMTVTVASLAASSLVKFGSTVASNVINAARFSGAIKMVSSGAFSVTTPAITVNAAQDAGLQGLANITSNATGDSKLINFDVNTSLETGGAALDGLRAVKPNASYVVDIPTGNGDISFSATVLATDLAEISTSSVNNALVKQLRDQAPLVSLSGSSAAARSQVTSYSFARTEAVVPGSDNVTVTINETSVAVDLNDIDGLGTAATTDQDVTSAIVRAVNAASLGITATSSGTPPQYGVTLTADQIGQSFTVESFSFTDASSSVTQPQFGLVEDVAARSLPVDGTSVAIGFGNQTYQLQMQSGEIIVTGAEIGRVNAYFDASNILQVFGGGTLSGVPLTVLSDTKVSGNSTGAARFGLTDPTTRLAGQTITLASGMVDLSLTFESTAVTVSLSSAGVVSTVPASVTGLTLRWQAETATTGRLIAEYNSNDYALSLATPSNALGFKVADREVGFQNDSISVKSTDNSSFVVTARGVSLASTRVKLNDLPFEDFLVFATGGGARSIGAEYNLPVITADTTTYEIRTIGDSGNMIEVWDADSGHSIATRVVSGDRQTSYDDFSFTLHGKSEKGDVFTLEQDAASTGDSRNLERILQLEKGIKGVAEKSGFQEFFGAMIAEVGSSVRASKIAAEVQEENLMSAREIESEFSGVNLDTEAAALIEFQQAYQASARILSTARELFQSLMEVV